MDIVKLLCWLAIPPATLAQFQLGATHYTKPVMIHSVRRITDNYTNHVAIDIDDMVMHFGRDGVYMIHAADPMTGSWQTEINTQFHYHALDKFYSLISIHEVSNQLWILAENQKAYFVAITSVRMGKLEFALLINTTHESGPKIHIKPIFATRGFDNNLLIVHENGSVFDFTLEATYDEWVYKPYRTEHKVKRIALKQRGQAYYVDFHKNLYRNGKHIVKNFRNNPLVRHGFIAHFLYWDSSLFIIVDGHPGHFDHSSFTFIELRESDLNENYKFSNRNIRKDMEGVAAIAFNLKMCVYSTQNQLFRAFKTEPASTAIKTTAKITTKKKTTTKKTTTKKKTAPTTEESKTATETTSTTEKTSTTNKETSTTSSKTTTKNILRNIPLPTEDEQGCEQDEFRSTANTRSSHGVILFFSILANTTMSRFDTRLQGIHRNTLLLACVLLFQTFSFAV